MSSTDDPTDDEVVRTAARAAEDVVFSRLSRSDVEDLDITVSFDDGVLDVDVYLNASENRADADRVADDAALAARGAVDDLFS
jgi:hypothetical protein